MTTTAEPATVAVDDLQGWVDLIDQADAKIGELEQVKKQARAQIEQRLGDAEVGTVNDRPRTVPSVSRRFTLVHEDDE